MNAIVRPCIVITQPIGTFYLTSISAAVLANRVRMKPRDTSSPDNEDVQRAASKTRIREISHYVRDPDATFPTAIIISADSRHVVVDEETITFLPLPGQSSEKFELGELLDGQHRIKGLREAEVEGVDISGFEIPVVVMLDLDVAEKAYVFSIINSKQTPVSKSLIYDLFGLSKERSPYTVCHEIARAMNTDPTGPFYQGLKMLGKKQAPTEMLTQGSFVKYLLRQITSTPDDDVIALKTDNVLKENNRPFNAFFRNNRDELILQTMTNYFSAVKNVFSTDWAISSYVTSDGKPVDGPTPVLRRTVGYEALMRALGIIWPEVQACARNDREFFLEIVGRFKSNVGDMDLTTREFGSSSADAGRLASALVGNS